MPPSAPNGQLVHALGLSALLLACAHEPSPLEGHARARYAMAVQDPSVRKYASVELYEAQRSLERLQRAVRHGAEEVELEHGAYLTQKRVEIARLAAEGAALEAKARILAEHLISRQQNRRAEDVHIP